MSFYELAKSRWSVRAYKDTPIEEEKMQLILEAGRVAPTAKNFQPQRIYVVKSAQARQKLKTVCNCTWDAPVVLVVACDQERVCLSKMNPGQDSGKKDISIVCTHMMLQAWELGIGSCWVGLFNEEQVGEVLGLPKHHRVVTLMPMGYPAENAEPLPLHSQIREFADTITVI